MNKRLYKKKTTKCFCLNNILHEKSEVLNTMQPELSCNLTKNILIKILPELQVSEQVTIKIPNL